MASTDPRTATQGQWEDLANKVNSKAEIGTVLSTPSDVAYVASGNIIDGAVTTAKIANEALTTDKIVNSAVTTSKIADGAVTDAKVDYTTLKRWVPDYDNYGSTNLWSDSATATMTGNGFVYAFINVYRVNNNSECDIKINDKKVATSKAEARGPNSAVVCDCTGTFPVSVGDVVSYDAHSGAINNRDCYFIPGKWI